MSLQSRFARMFRSRSCISSIIVGAMLLIAAPAMAETAPGWGKWWLPPVHSEHGPAIDSLFRWIFWITMITFVVVELVLVIFLVKYRARPERKKAYFTHGNQKLEMAWTVAPAIILALLALGSKKVWDNYRYSPDSDDPGRAKVLVIGQQFKWNFIYPGPDGKFGRYLLYPHPTDATWPVGADGQPTLVNFKTYQNTKGPADMPFEDAVGAINQYIDSENPLGKDFSDPDGKDDDWAKAPGRGLILPAHRPIEVQLSSKDVIHDFYLPNFRVKLDAVPGMRGVLYFKSSMTSAELRKVSVRNVPIDQLGALLDTPGGKTATIVVDENAPGSEKNRDLNRGTWRYFSGDAKTTVIRNGASFPEDAETRNARIASLKEAGLTEVRMTMVEETGDWELVCEELCGQGHNTMTATVTFLSNDEYDAKHLDLPYRPASTTAPAAR